MLNWPSPPPSPPSDWPHVPPPHPSPTISLSNLDPERLQRAQDILTAVLDSKAAQNTFAQIIDGLPTHAAFRENFQFNPTLPEILEREQPSEESIKLFTEIRARFQLANLEIPVKIAQPFQDAKLDSRDFNLRLLEMISVAIHILGGTTFRIFHPELQIFPVDYPHFAPFHYFVDFYHQHYMAYFQYPYGLLNVVGFWVETQIFGGVLLFERGESGNDNKNAFLHPPMRRVPHRNMFQLSNAQLEAFANPVSGPDNTFQFRESLLPFADNPEMPPLTDFYDRNIFRDEYSRLPKPRQSWCGGTKASEADEKMLQWIRRKVEREDREKAEGSHSFNL